MLHDLVVIQKQIFYYHFSYRTTQLWDVPLARFDRNKI